MTIERINKGSWGKVRAFFDIRTEEGLVVKGFKIMEGINGLFVSMPSQKGKNQQGEDEWFDTVWIEKELRDQLNQIALNEYGSQYDQTLSDNQESNSNMSNMATSEAAAPVAETSETMTSENTEENVQPFSDDDIPF